MAFKSLLFKRFPDPQLHRYKPGPVEHQHGQFIFKLLALMASSSSFLISTPGLLKNIVHEIFVNISMLVVL